MFWKKKYVEQTADEKRRAYYDQKGELSRKLNTVKLCLTTSYLYDPGIFINLLNNCNKIISNLEEKFDLDNVLFDARFEPVTTDSKITSDLNKKNSTRREEIQELITQKLELELNQELVLQNLINNAKKRIKAEVPSLKRYVVSEGLQKEIEIDPDSPIAGIVKCRQESIKNAMKIFKEDLNKAEDIPTLNKVLKTLQENVSKACDEAQAGLEEHRGIHNREKHPRINFFLDITRPLAAVIYLILRLLTCINPLLWLMPEPPSEKNEIIEAGLLCGKVKTKSSKLNQYYKNYINKIEAEPEIEVSQINIPTLKSR